MAARTALVKELKADGRKDDAAAVAKLRRPSVAAWALNQVAREKPDLVETAIDAGEKLRAASDAAVAGRPGELRAATAAERTAANAVVKAAAAHLGARADATAPALLATIRVAALDEEVADQLRRGVLVTEQEQPGFGFGMDVDRPALTLVPDLKPKAKKATKSTGQARRRPRPPRHRQPPRPPSRPSGRRRRGRRSGKRSGRARRSSSPVSARRSARSARPCASPRRPTRPRPKPRGPRRGRPSPSGRRRRPRGRRRAHLTPSVCAHRRHTGAERTQKQLGVRVRAGCRRRGGGRRASRCRSRGGRRARRRSRGGW